MHISLSIVCNDLRKNSKCLSQQYQEFSFWYHPMCLLCAQVTLSFMKKQAVVGSLVNIIEDLEVYLVGVIIYSHHFFLEDANIRAHLALSKYTFRNAKPKINQPACIVLPKVHLWDSNARVDFWDRHNWQNYYIFNWICFRTCHPSILSSCLFSQYF